MTGYLVSLLMGLAVGVAYGLVQVRSPAPPLIALVGLLGMVLGEQMVNAVRPRGRFACPHLGPATSRPFRGGSLSGMPDEGRSRGYVPGGIEDAKENRPRPTSRFACPDFVDRGACIIGRAGLGSFELIRQGYRDAIVLNTVGVFTRKALSFKTSRRKLPAESSSGMPQTINLCAEPLGLHGEDRAAENRADHLHLAARLVRFDRYCTPAPSGCV